MTASRSSYVYKSHFAQTVFVLWLIVNQKPKSIAHKIQTNLYFLFQIAHKTMCTIGKVIRNETKSKLKHRILHLRFIIMLSEFGIVNEKQKLQQNWRIFFLLSLSKQLNNKNQQENILR